MKTLYLIRHAKSSWKHPGLTDFERPLNSRGKKDAPFMGKVLKKRNIKPDVIISSPAKRAIKTAKLISKEIEFPKSNIVIEKSIYEGSVFQIFNVIRSIDNSNNIVFLIGHNPDFTSLANYLSNYPINNLPTCGIFCVEFNTASWKEVTEGIGVFKFYDFPKNYTYKN